MVESGFLDIDGQSFPPEAIEPLPAVSGSTSICAMVRLNGKRLFMKRLRPEFVGHPRYVALMRKEYETGTTLSHPNLVQYVSWGEDIEGPYLLTDYIDGVTLADQIERWKTAPPTAPQVCSIFTQLLQSLGYLHSHQVIHLDLKPDNIMLTRVGNVVKLIDLGFCYTDGYDLSMGRNAVFSAPEQQTKEVHPDHRADLYAVGRLLETVQNLLPKGVQHRLYSVIQRSTANNPADRYTSADEMLADITKNIRGKASLTQQLSNYKMLSCLVAVALILFLWGIVTILSTPTTGLTTTDSFPAAEGYTCRITSRDEHTCTVTDCYHLTPDNNLQIFSPVPWQGEQYTVTTIAESAFYSMPQLLSLSVPEDVTHFGHSACFRCRNLTAVSLPTTLTHIGHDAFSSCHKLSTLILPSGLQYIGHGAFVADSALHHITIPEGIKVLPTDCFVSSGLRSITLPSQLRVLERGVFYQCRSLRSITLPASIERIGDFCFHDCDSLLEVTIHNPVPPNISDVFSDTTGLRRTLYVPAGCIEAYRQARFWQDFAVIKAIE